MIMFFIGMVLLGINIATLGSGAATALGAINAATAIFTEFLGDAMQRAVFISDMQSQFSRILKSQREALLNYLNENELEYSCGNGSKEDQENMKCEIKPVKALSSKQIVEILKKTDFGIILSELYEKWLTEKYGKDKKKGEQKVGNLLVRAHEKIAKIKKKCSRYIGEKKLFTISELVDISLDEAWSGQQYLSKSEKYNSIDDPAEQKEYQDMWNWMLDTFQKKAVTTVLCKSEQLQLIAMAHILKTTREEPDEEKLADEIAERVVVLKKLLNMNPGGYTLRDVEAGKSFLANYMVNNRCPECGYIGDGVFRDGANGHRLLCAACGADVSFEQYAAPEVYQKYAEMVDTKLNEFKAAYEEHCNKHKEELQLSFDEFKDQIISAFTKLEISQKIRLDEHGESIARLDESVGELSEEVKKLLDKLTEELKQHENDVQAFAEAINQSRKWQEKADNYFKEIFNKLSAGEERLDKIDESIKELINNQRIDIAALNKDLNKDFNALSKKIDEASQQNTKEHGEIMQQLTQILTELNKLATRIAIIDGEIIQSKSKGQSNEVEQLSRIRADHENLAARIASIEEVIQPRTEEYSEVKKQLSQISARLAEQTARIEGIERALKTPPQSSQPSDGPYAPTITPSTSGGSSNASKPTVNTSPVSAHPVPTSESRCAYCGAKDHFESYVDSQGIQRCKCMICEQEFEELNIAAKNEWRASREQKGENEIGEASKDGILYVTPKNIDTNGEWRAIAEPKRIGVIICSSEIKEIRFDALTRSRMNRKTKVVYMKTGEVMSFAQIQ